MNISYTTFKRKYSYCSLAIILLLILLQTLQPVLSQGVVDAVDDYPTTLLNNQDYTFSAPGLLDNDTPGVTIVSSDTSATAGAVVTVNADGSWSVTSAAGFVGNTTFTYTIDDSTGAQDTTTVYLTYEAPPPPPTTIDALDDYPTNLLNNQDYVFSAPGLLGNDSFGVTIVSSDTSATAGGVVTVNADGSWSVTSAAGFVGNTTFTYRLTFTIPEVLTFIPNK